MMTIIWFLLLLSVLVLAHEAGHFFVAKWAGMKVEEFGFGFPPRLFSLRRGETVYSVNLIPLGGFVRILGENGEDRNEPRSFGSKSRTKRFFVLVAGVVMNILLAWALLFGGFVFGLPTVVEEVPKGASVTDRHIEVLYVLPGAPAEEAGLKAGDRILSVAGHVVSDAKSAREVIGESGIGEDVTLAVLRGEETMIVSATAEELSVGLVGIGVQLSDIGTVRFPVHRAFVQGAIGTWNLTAATADGFASLIARLVRGGETPLEVSGPVGIAVMAGEMAKEGLGRFVFFAALLSVNLAILNVLPIPALDGGRILFLAIEALRRRPTTPSFERAVHALGFFVLMALVVLVTYRDIVGLFK